MALVERNEVLNFPCAEQLSGGQRELTAFYNAVRSLHGLDEARHAAEQWIDELRHAKSLPLNAREWRGITVRAAATLAADAVGCAS